MAELSYVEDALPVMQRAASRLAASRLGRVARLDPREFYGSGWLALADAAETFNPSDGTKFTTFALKRLRGEMLEWLWAESHGHRRRHTPAPVWVEITEANMVAEGVDPEEETARAELAVVVRNAVERLPDWMREVVTLYYFEGLLLREIGEILGITESGACLRLTRAANRLRHLLAAPRLLGEI